MINTRETSIRVRGGSVRGLYGYSFEQVLGRPGGDDRGGGEAVSQRLPGGRAFWQMEQSV